VEGPQRDAGPGGVPQGDLRLGLFRVRAREKPARDSRAYHVSASPGLHRVRARGRPLAPDLSPSPLGLRLGVLSEHREHVLSRWAP
jgi:hypothetical protein